MRGDEPAANLCPPPPGGRLPHMRGDEPHQKLSGELDYAVCPTCVGMNRPLRAFQLHVQCLPHMRGDEPGGTPDGRERLRVCPTCVGMNRTTARTGLRLFAVCPTCVGMNRSARSRRGSNSSVCPTCVGMNREYCRRKGYARRLPHMFEDEQKKPILRIAESASGVKSWRRRITPANASRSRGTSPSPDGASPPACCRDSARARGESRAACPSCRTRTSRRCSTTGSSPR